MSVVRPLFWVYRRIISPAIHSAGMGGVSQCRFQPSCSEYAEVALARFGPWRGSMLAVWRIMRCNPFSKGGLDNVPPA